MRTPEGFEKSQIKKYLDSLGVWHFSPYMKGFGKTGVPDIIACVPVTITQDMVGQTVGMFAGIEVKREGGKPTANQIRCMAQIEDAYGKAFVGTAEIVVGWIRAWLRA